MSDEQHKNMTRREMLGSAGKTAAASLVLASLPQDLFVSAAIGADAALPNAVAGPGRILFSQRRDS
jgi:hypothetical protein